MAAIASGLMIVGPFIVKLIEEAQKAEEEGKQEDLKKQVDDLAAEWDRKKVADKAFDQEFGGSNDTNVPNASNPR